MTRRARRAAGFLAAIWLAGALLSTRADEPERRMFRIAAPDQISLLELLNQLRPTMGGHYTFPEDLGAKNVRFTGGLEIPYRDGFLAEDVRAFYGTLLQIQGFSMVDRGTITEIVAAAQALQRPTHIYNQDEIGQLPATDTLVAVMYTFKNFDANQLGPRLQDLLIQGVEKVIAVPQSRTIMLVAYASKLRELVRLLEAMDTSSPDAQLRPFELVNAAADEILRPLEQLMNARLQIGTGGTLPPGAPRQPGRESAAAPVLVADPRSNRAIYAIALPSDLDMIGELVTLLDREIQSPGSRIRFYPLQYRSVEARTSAGGGEGEQPESGLKEILQEMYEERARVEEARADAGAPPGGAGTSPAANRTSDALVPRFVSDPDTNHLIVIYPSERYIPEVEDAIQRLDRRTPQVFLEAVILELGQDATRELGIEIASIEEEPSGSGHSPRFGGGTNFGMSSPTEDGTGRTPIFTTGSLTAFLFKDQFEHIPILMRLLRTDADSQVLAVPRIMTDANKKAIFDITQAEPLQVTTQGTATTQTATQYEEAKTTLDVTPSVGIESVPTGRTDEEGNPILARRYFVRMRLKQTIETFTQPFGGGTAPAKNSRTAETSQITIPDGATVIFGGFTNKTRRTTQARVPFFGSIPLLGNLFRSKRDTDVYTTIFVFLTPHVIADGEDLATLEGRLRSFEELASLRNRIAPLLPTPDGARPPPDGDARRTREGYTWPD